MGPLAIEAPLDHCPRMTWEIDAKTWDFGIQATVKKCDKSAIGLQIRVRGSRLTSIGRTEKNRH